MKYKQVLFLFFIFPVFTNAQDFFKQGYFVIKGHAKNYSETLIDFGMTTYLDNLSQSIKVTDGNFEQQFPIRHSQDVFLYLNDDAITFTLHDKDTITIEWDEKNFRNSFTIKGNNENRTKELNLQWKLYNEFRKPMLDLSSKLYADSLTGERRYQLINSLYNKNLQAVFDYDLLTKNTKVLLKNLYFEFANMLQIHQLIPEYHLQPSITGKWAYLAKETPGIFGVYTTVSEEWFYNSPEYRNFIYNYLRFYWPFKSYSTISNTPARVNITQEQYYSALAYIRVPDVRDWFITKVIKDGFGWYGFSDVENVYKQAIGVMSNVFLKDTLQAYYAAIRRLKPGNPSPEFTLTDEKGEAVSLNEFRGKVVYIDFWGVYCGPCIYDIRNYAPKLHEHYKDKDVVFINICVDSKPAEWKAALKKFNLSGVNLIAEGWANHPVCKDYNVSGIPHYVLIDKNGKIVLNNAPRASGFDLTSGKNQIDLLL